MFKQMYLSETIFELASVNMNHYISPVPIHEYIQKKLPTCTREVAGPILSQNIDLICSSQGQTGKRNANTHLTMFSEPWHHLFRVNVEVEVTRDT